MKEMLCFSKKEDIGLNTAAGETDTTMIYEKTDVLLSSVCISEHLHSWTTFPVQMHINFAAEVLVPGDWDGIDLPDAWDYV